MTRGEWIKGLAVGAAVGAAAGVLFGLLYAPERGARTRRQIVRKAEDLGERAADALESAGDFVERGRRRVGL